MVLTVTMARCLDVISEPLSYEEMAEMMDCSASRILMSPSLDGLRKKGFADWWLSYECEDTWWRRII